MARGHVDLPASAPPLLLSKAEIYEALKRIDADETARARVLQMETRFRAKIDTHLASLPAASAQFQKFSTSPFVLLFHSKRQGYERVSQVERDIIPAKVFSSMETSAGRMVEDVVLPVYGWQVVPSQMHSSESVLDGRKTEEDDFLAATLKSGPRCLNDEMAQQIGRDVVANLGTWAEIMAQPKSSLPMECFTELSGNPIRKTGTYCEASRRFCRLVQMSSLLIAKLGALDIT